MRRGQRHGLVRTDDDLRKVTLPAFGPRLREGLDDARVIAAEVRKDIADPGFG
jgi:hypothetical protein